MGIIQRFADIMKANINDLLDKCEDPAKMVEQTLRDLSENLAEVKKETAGVMAEETRCKRVLGGYKEEQAKWDDLARKAVAAGNDGDAREFLTKKASMDAKIADAQKMYDLASSNATKMRQMHDKLVSDINELNSRKEMIKSKAAVAKTQKKINNMTAGSNTAGTMRKFDSIESRVDRELDAAMAEAELNSTPKDSADELASKYSGGGAAGVDEALAALKAEMGMA